MAPSPNLCRTLKIILGLGLIAALFSVQSIDLTAIQTLEFHTLPFIGMIVCTFMFTFLGAIKWQRITHQWEGANPRLQQTFHQTALTLFWAQFMPLPMATAAIRAKALTLDANKSLGHSLGHATYDLGFDFIIVLIMIAATLLQIALGFAPLYWIMCTIFFYIIVLALLTQSRTIITLFLKISAHFACLEKANAQIRQIRDHGLLVPAFMREMMALGSARFVMVTTRLVLGAMTCGLIIPWEAITYASPLAVLPSLVPLTPANLGVAEWSWTYLLAHWQVPLTTAVLFATSFRILALGLHAFLALATTMHTLLWARKNAR